MVEAGVLNTLDNRQVCVVKFDVLTDQANAHWLGGIFNHRHHALP